MLTCVNTVTKRPDGQYLHVCEACGRQRTLEADVYYRYCLQQEYREPVGDRLTEMLEAMGIHQRVCGCKPMQHRMNMLGASWCRANRGKIIEHLLAAANAGSTALPFGFDLKDLLGDLVDEAIRRAELSAGQ